MESTGVYWIPIWNALERGFTLTLVNPATVRALQGQKTDRIDARRIAEYLQYGLLRGSFIPPTPIRQLRELTRMRAHLQQDRNRVINHNLKLASVASNIVGMSAMAMLRLLASGVRDAERLAACAQGHMRVKIPALILALDGRPDAHFRWMLGELLAKLDQLDQQRARVDARIDERALPYEDLLRRLATIPGVDRTTALVLLAEFGEDLTQFPTASHLASLGRAVPRQRGERRQAFFRTHAQGRPVCAPHSGAECLGGFACQRLFSGGAVFSHRATAWTQKAAVAVAHRILIIAWHMLAEPSVAYRERGGDHFDRRNPERTARKLTRRLEAIGYQVSLVAPPKPFGATPPIHSQTTPQPVVDPSVCPKCARWGCRAASA